ncbi:MAG: hypothetical protein OQK48_08310 [Sulfurimonas sp.]|uniref:hypothetical protein n=1 Tax=Sulfurimonas sp. TaxID=2022749 RepID=UPI002620F50D|nr:hypothetical protein [Sulfurimonas sp.]MCW8895887.1 hypothetical protein [Sulfurimonas sp.]MCW8954934.1 hypothetical protein [Sulfurimonas sp.]MCW9067571.1 hypothetical protein [Sulfurimonas sp.]
MKAIITLLFSSLVLLASETNHLQVKILETIITNIHLDKNIVVWSDNKNLLAELKKHNVLLTTNICEDATVIILQDKRKLEKECSSKHIFVLNYNSLSHVPQSFGALFWKKGRPNIVLIEPRIKSQLIKISKDLEPYLEERVW